MKISLRSVGLVGLVMLLVVAGCRKSSTPAATQTAATQPTVDPQQQYHHDGGPVPAAPQTKFFKGSIGSALDLQMRLVRDGGNLTGSYFYQKVGTKIDLKGTVDDQGNLVLEELDGSGKSTGVFKGLWKVDATGLVDIAGNWSKPNSDKRTAFSLHEEPIQFSGATEITAKKIKENSKKPKYEIDVEYPQISGATGTFDKFNQLAKSLVLRKVAEFKKDVAERVNEDTAATADSDAMGSDLGIGYDIGLAQDDLVSIEFNIGGYYAGAAHPNSYTEVINYDLKNNVVLKLGDLFKPGAKFLQTMSSFAIKELKDQAKKEGPDSMLTNETISEGAGPDLKNYKSWTITKKGLSIAFDSYQVAPYAAGPQRVIIPYAALKDLIKPDGPLGSFIK